MSDNNPNIDQIRAAAEGGDAKAQFQLAICYMKGAGVPRDFAQGVGWMKKAAEGGLAEAQYPMGLFTAEGKGVKQDKAASIEWFAKAAEQGHKDAQRSLAKIALVAYQETGNETAKAGALKWFKAAADQGDAEAKAELEKMLAGETDENANDGEDGATPEELRRRAESGDADACYRLGNMYYEGNGVEENGPEAFRWHMRGAELGNAGSACSVASCYMGGDCGVKEDKAEGIRWYKKAAKWGTAKRTTFWECATWRVTASKRTKQRGRSGFRKRSKWDMSPTKTTVTRKRKAPKWPSFAEKPRRGTPKRVIGWGTSISHMEIPKKMKPRQSNGTGKARNWDIPDRSSVWAPVT